jgi:hypothetical protein
MLYNCGGNSERVVEFILQALSEEEIGEEGAILFSFIQDDGTCVLNYDNASIQELIVMQGQIGLAITRRYLEVNYPEIINEENRCTEDEEV